MFFPDINTVELLLQSVINTITMLADSRALDSSKTAVVLWFCESQTFDSSPPYLTHIL